MPPLPRHPDLDRRLAEEGSTPEILQVYGDWLAEREHPLGAAIRDAVLAERGDKAARARTVARRFEATDPKSYGTLGFVWCTGALAAVEFTASRYDRHDQWLPALFDEPWAALTTQLRIEAEAWQSDLEISDVLYLLPPSVGRLEIVDARVPSEPVEDSVDLSAVDLPHLRDLRLRTGPLLGLPARTDGIVRFELCTPSPPALRRPLPSLQTLHVFSGVGEAAVAMLVEGARSLRQLGIHHAGALHEVVSLLSKVALPQTLETLVLAVPQPQPADLPQILRDLSRLVPLVQRIYLPFADPASAAPLPGHVTTDVAPDQPFYVL